MFAYLKGELQEITEDNIVIDVNDIGYNVKVSSSTVQQLPGIGSKIKIFTYTLVREDTFSLYGFLTRDELDIFKKLITVNGIGPKGGLAILSVLSADALKFAIMTGDAKAIAKAPGVGAKTAERVILDLKDKISLEDTLTSYVSGNNVVSDDSLVDNVMKKEAIEALIALGYSSTDATSAVKKVELSADSSVESILKAALKYIF